MWLKKHSLKNSAASLTVKGKDCMTKTPQVPIVFADGIKERIELKSISQHSRTPHHQLQFF